MSRIINKLSEALQKASVFNPEVQVAPACILWPDRDRQWESALSRLQNELPVLFVLGEYSPSNRCGPAIWLRCVIAGKIEGIQLAEEKTPILYLPGVGRQELRAIENCPEHLKPLAELQYRGTIWSQMNSKDWTILSFLKSDQGGLGLDVAQDNDTKKAMQMALDRLLDEEIGLLRKKRLEKDYFNTLLTGGDPVRDLLRWIDQGDAFRAERSTNEWKGFVEVCKSKFAFNPEKEGVLGGAEKLACCEGPWQSVWERFCEAPSRYKNISEQIRKCKMPATELFSNEKSHGGWPQWNEDREECLRNEMRTLANVTATQANDKILELEKQHGGRRKLVWAELDDAPLACALEFLLVLTKIIKKSLAAGNIDEIACAYARDGWLADDALVQSLSYIQKPKDYEALSAAIRAMYLPWAEEYARYLQTIVERSGYPNTKETKFTVEPYNEGECLLFVDGLRFDTAKRLAGLLKEQGFLVEEKPAWAALPSVTATGKPAVTPIKDKFSGSDLTSDFEPHVAETTQSLKGGYHLKKIMTSEGWTMLDRSANGDGKGKAWCEFGNIDHEGHGRGWKLALHIKNLLNEIKDRVIQLIRDGDWKSVRIVTDHGWLLLPGGLPKTEIPSTLTVNKWGRCAAIKQGASIEERLYPWYWNQNRNFALADGISCFRKGEEYAHGGLSLQECLTLELNVLPGTQSFSNPSIEVTDLVWKGLRCTVAVDGNFSGLSLDIRKEPGNSSSSVIVSVKQLKDNGTVSVVVENEELEGTDATIVLLYQNDQVVANVPTIIGGGEK